MGQKCYNAELAPWNYPGKRLATLGRIPDLISACASLHDQTMTWCMHVLSIVTGIYKATDSGWQLWYSEWLTLRVPCSASRLLPCRRCSSGSAHRESLYWVESSTSRMCPRNWRKPWSRTQHRAAVATNPRVSLRRGQAMRMAATHKHVHLSRLSCPWGLDGNVKRENTNCYNCIEMLCWTRSQHDTRGSEQGLGRMERVEIPE